MLAAKGLAGVALAVGEEAGKGRALKPRADVARSPGKVSQSQQRVSKYCKR